MLSVYHEASSHFSWLYPFIAQFTIVLPEVDSPLKHQIFIHAKQVVFFWIHIARIIAHNYISIANNPNAGSFSKRAENSTSMPVSTSFPGVDLSHKVKFGAGYNDAGILDGCRGEGEQSFFVSLGISMSVIFLSQQSLNFHTIQLDLCTEAQ